MSKKKSIAVLILTFVLFAVVGVACFASFPITATKDYNSIMSLIGRGIDLSGGYYVVLTPKVEASNQDEADNIVEMAMETLRARLDDKGFTEATISRQDGNRIRVEVPEVENADEVLQIIGNTGTLSFQDSSKHEWLSGEDIKSAFVSYDNDNGYVCVLNFTNAGMAKFSEATGYIKDLDDPTMYIYLGDTVVSQPTVNMQITNSSAEITGFSDYDSAEAVASVIENGRLPIEYTVSESRSISARLGENAIMKSLMAAGIALVIIFALMIVFYRGMGVASCISLIFYVLAYIILLAIIPNVQITLPGIAGILLSIGMAVDGNVVIFERIRAAFKEGKVNTAVDAGFKSAVITIVDSNVTTILSSIVLWILCPGTIKAFAITLLVGIVLSLFVSVVITRFALKVVGGLSQNKEKLFNLKKEVA